MFARIIIHEDDLFPGNLINTIILWFIDIIVFK